MNTQNAIALANENNIAVHFEYKYVKGLKARGPRNVLKANNQAVEQAIKDGSKSVTIWVD